MPAISFNILTKDAPGATKAAIDSLYEHLFRDGDEVLVLDTGSSEENRAVLDTNLKDCVECLIIDAPELQMDYADRIERWIPECVEEWGGKTGLRSFAEAREILRRASSNKIIFWLDSDDVFEEERSGALRTYIDKYMESPEKADVDAIFLDYHYAFAEDGTCTTILKRERAFFRDRYEWRGDCHETAVPKHDMALAPRRVGYFDGLHSQIRHTEARKPHRQSDIRNYVILRESLEAGPDFPDPRTLFYLGNSARGLERREEATAYYDAFLPNSGSPDDRFAANYYMAGMALDDEVRRPVDALDYYTKCVQIKPGDPRGYFGLSRVYLHLQRFDDSLREYHRGTGLSINLEREVHTVDPTHTNYLPHIVAATAAKELGRAEESVRFAEIAARARPGFQPGMEFYQQVAMEASGDLLSDSVLHVLGNLKHQGPNARRVGREIVANMEITPPKLEKNGIAKLEPPDPRPACEQAVAIFCGGSAENWGSHSRQSGIGGSEKMVLLISKELQSRGVNVTVYGEVAYKARGVDEDGVMWRHWAEFDEARPRDVLVCWRQPKAAAAIGCPARKRIVWLHDVPRPDDYTEEVLAATDLFQVQSEYHAGLLEGCGVPREKIWVARNAIDTYVKFGALDRDPKQVVYLSSPDRGLLTAAKIVAKAREKDPEIHLVAAYGINRWSRKGPRHRHVPDVGHDVDFDVYERNLNRALDEAGATQLHRIGFDAVSALLSGSGVWLYPCRFAEISCMAAMETQAHGVIPVSTGFGALSETLLKEPRLGPLVPGEASEEYIDDAAKKLIAATKVSENDLRRVALSDEAIWAYTITGLGDMWIENLFPSEDTVLAAGAPPKVASVQPAGEEVV